MAELASSAAAESSSVIRITSFWGSERLKHSEQSVGPIVEPILDGFGVAAQTTQQGKSKRLD
ncbi:hypothetical protein OAE79_00275 [Rhodopirellula sp.]|jgi:hypothetical protein|nr:hypothetical protein [Rhodopirellula sp.]MDB4809825.1 hypothetical protein [bacterium]